MKKALASIAALVIVGCGAPAYIDQTDAYIKQGNCNAALRTVENSGEWIGRRSYMIAGVFATCHKNQSQAIKWATLSARYGVEAARDYLARVGAPIPSPDLDDSSPSDAALILQGLGAAAQGYSAGRSGGDATIPYQPSQGSNQPARIIKKIEPPKSYDCRSTGYPGKAICDER